MAVPKQKISKSRRGQRRSHLALKSSSYIVDRNSGEVRRPHHMDMSTGVYRGKQILRRKVDETSETEA